MFASLSNLCAQCLVSLNFVDPTERVTCVYAGVPRYCLVVDGNTAEQREELIDILSHHLWIIGLWCCSTAIDMYGRVT